MPIGPFLQHDHSFDPEDIANMSAGFEAALSKLGVVSRDNRAKVARQDDHRGGQRGRARSGTAMRPGSESALEVIGAGNEKAIRELGRMAFRMNCRRSPRFRSPSISPPI